MAAVDGDNEDLSWDESERNLEPTSSEDELLATCAVDGTFISFAFHSSMRKRRQLNGRFLQLKLNNVHFPSNFTHTVKVTVQ